MSIDIAELNATLLTAFKNSNFIIVGEKALQAANATKLETETKLDSDKAEIGGLKSLTNTVVGPSVMTFTTILAPTKVNDSDDSDINLITGTRTVNARLNTVIGSGTPTAVGDALKTVTNTNASAFRANLETIAVDSAKDEVTNIDAIINDGVDNSVGFSQSINSYNNNFNNLIGFGAVTLLGNLILSNQSGIIPVIDKVAPTITPSKKQNIIDLLLAGRKREAIEDLEKVSNNFTATQIESELEQVDISQSSVINRAASPEVGKKTTPDYIIGQDEKNWKNEDTNTATGAYSFTYVGSKEELVAEMREANRAITEFVAHWTATFTNQDIGSEEVHAWHKERGFLGIGYHYVIRRDGRLQRGRPLNNVGAHSKAYNHNKYSIGITMAGGYNCPIGTPNPERFQSADSLTAAQMKTFEMFVAAFYDVWPGGQAWGHNDTSDQGKIDPGFDVQEYVFNKFGKKNVYTDGTLPESAMHPTELQAARS